MNGGASEGDLTLHGLWVDLSSILIRRKKVVLVVALGVVLAVYVGLMFIGDLFEAQASLLVRMGRENAEVPVTVEKGGLFPTGVRKEDINSYIALLTSRPLLEATVAEIGHERFHPELPRPATFLGWFKYVPKVAIRWGRTQLGELEILLGLKRRLTDEELAFIALSRSLKAEREKDADVISLHLRLPDAALARDVLRVLAEKYLARHVEVIRRDSSALQVFEQEVQSYTENLRALRDRMSGLKSDLGVFAVAEQKQQLLEMLRTAELGRLEAERDNARNEAELLALKDCRSRVDETQLSTQAMAPSAARSKLRQALADLQVERGLALNKYLPGADPVRKIESQIADLESALEHAPAEEPGARTLARNPVLAWVESRSAEDEVRARALASMITRTSAQTDRIKLELKRLDQAESELQRLQMEITIAESRLLANAARREEARAQETLDRWKVANVSLLAPASCSDKPVSPNRLLIVGMGIVGGLLSGFVVALLLEWKEQVIHAPQDLDRITPGLCLGTFSVGSGGGVANLSGREA